MLVSTNAFNVMLIFRCRICKDIIVNSYNTCNSSVNILVYLAKVSIGYTLIAQLFY